MKLSALLAGKKAEREVTFPFATEAGPDDIKCLLIPLTAAEEREVFSYAAETAKEHRGEAKEGDPIYDLAVMAKTIEMSCLDPDSPIASRQRLADGGPEQVQKLLGRDVIAYLYERQQAWQDEHSPSVRRLTSDQLLAKVLELAEAEDDLPFVRLSPGLRWICMRSMARLLSSSLGGKSLDGSVFAAHGVTSNSEH